MMKRMKYKIKVIIVQISEKGKSGIDVWTMCNWLWHTLHFPLRMRVLRLNLTKFDHWWRFSFSSHYRHRDCAEDFNRWHYPLMGEASMCLYRQVFIPFLGGQRDFWNRSQCKDTTSEGRFATFRATQFEINISREVKHWKAYDCEK